MLSYKKTLLKIWLNVLNPGLNLTIFRGTGPGWNCIIPWNRAKGAYREKNKLTTSQIVQIVQNKTSHNIKRKRQYLFSKA